MSDLTLEQEREAAQERIKRRQEAEDSQHALKNPPDRLRDGNRYREFGVGRKTR